MRKLTDKQITNIFFDTGDIEHFKNTYAVDIRSVKKIKAQESHIHITQLLQNPGQIIKYRLSPDDVEFIFSSIKPYTQLASQFDIHLETVRNIKKGVTRAYEEWF